MVKISTQPDKALECLEVTAKISFRTALEVIETASKHPWIDGTYFCLRDAEILEQAGASIREKLGIRSA